MRLRSLSLMAVLSYGCANTEQDRVSLPLLVSGSDLSEPVVAAGDVPIIVEQAQLAFGPFWICAGATAGDLCSTARLEWLDTSVIDLTAQDPAEVGELEGITGQVRSWMYDLGISSQLTQIEPFVLDAAAELDGASFVLVGRANIDGTELPFRAAVPIMQSETTEQGVPVIRKSTSEQFSHEVTSDRESLLVKFDASSWIASLDLRPYLEDKACSPDGRPIVCAGSVEQLCNSEGDAENTRDCSEAGQICITAQGCVDELIIDPESEAFRSLRNALVSGAPPTLEWTVMP